MAKNKKKGKKGIKILCFLLVLVIGFFAGGFAYWRSLQNAVPEVEDTVVYDFDDETLPEKLEDAPEFEMMYEGDTTDFKQSLKNWATNGGEIMYDPYVINVLCLGVDTRNKNTVSGLTDSIIVLSINRRTSQVHLTSIMRDSYAYLQSPSGVGSYNKINSAFPFYGVDNLIETIQNHFKIRIDGYATINFSFFKAVIDKLGGVTVPVQQYEANYLNNSGNGFNVQAGDAVTLMGDEALFFCRSRKCDSDGDVSRTRRQRQVIKSIIGKAAAIDTTEIPEYVKTFLPYVETSFSEAELISLATKAVVGNWGQFALNEHIMPDENSRKAHSGDVWYWEVNYPLAAQTLQKSIYGKSNIVLNGEEVTAESTTQTESESNIE